ncbi:hypothetical protein P2318_04720 [Myxococcaceae bacterium GXIMD 01537]
MKVLKSLTFALAALTALTLLVPASSEAKPRGRKWESLGVVGFEGGPCYEIWTRNHWWHGWQVVHEPVPCPGENGYVTPGGPNTAVFFAEAAAFIRFDKVGNVDQTFGDAVGIPLEASDLSVAPVLAYGAEGASLQELSADAEQLTGVRIPTEVYPKGLLVRETHKIGKVLRAPLQAALVTLSPDGATIEKVHKVVQTSKVEPLK